MNATCVYPPSHGAHSKLFAIVFFYSLIYLEFFHLVSVRVNLSATEFIFSFSLCVLHLELCCHLEKIGRNNLSYIFFFPVLHWHFNCICALEKSHDNFPPYLFSCIILCMCLMTFLSNNFYFSLLFLISFPHLPEFLLLPYSPTSPDWCLFSPAYSSSLPLKASKNDKSRSLKKISR